jgi:hypothetical protein
MQYQQRGDKYNARDVLRKILSKDNHNEQAWLLFSEVAEKPEHEIQCLNNVLHINPENLQAKLRLQELEHFEYSKKDQPPISPKYQETQTTVDPNALKEKNSSFEFQQNHYPSILVNLHPKPQPSTSYGLNTPSEVNVLSPLRMPVISKHDGLILSPSEKGSQNILKSNTLLDSSSKNDGASSINNPVGQGSLTTANPNDLAAKRAALANAITAKNFAGKGVIVTSIFFGFVILCGFTSAPQLAAWILLIYFFCALFVIIYQRGQIPALDQTISTLQVEIRDLETQPINLLTTCKVCQREVAKTAPTCPHCGVSLPGLKVQCPNCGSMNVLVGEKGFSASNAIVGAALMGPLGVLGGLSGAKNLEYYCSSCQKRWVP